MSDQIHRNQAIDAAKGIGIIFVVYGHSIEPFFFYRTDGVFSQFLFLQWKVLYAFHMPLFFMLAGLVSTRLAERTLEQQLSRSVSLIVTAALAGCAGGVVAYGLYIHDSGSAPDWLLERTIAPIYRGASYITVVPWFLTSLAITQFVCFVALRYGRRGWLFLAGVLVTSVLLTAFTTVSAWQARTLHVGIVFFMLGYVVAKRPVAPSGRLAMSAGIALLGVAVLTALANHGCSWSLVDSCPNIVEGVHREFGVYIIGGLLGNLPLFLVSAVSGSLAIWCIGRALDGMAIARPLVWLGERSLPLMICNGFALEFLNPRIRNDPYPGDFMAIVLALVVVAVQIGLIWFAGRQVNVALAIIRSMTERVISLALGRRGREA